jgi:hypothetical protein
MVDNEIGNENPDQSESEAAKSHYVWPYFTVTNNTDPRKGGAKNALCMFCNKNFSEALPEQLHISWCVLLWAKKKQE